MNAPALAVAVSDVMTRIDARVSEPGSRGWVTQAQIPSSRRPSPYIRNAQPGADAGEEGPQ